MLNDYPIASGYVHTNAETMEFRTDADGLHGEYYPEDYDNAEKENENIYYYAIPWEHSEEVVAPLLFDLRISNYPQLVVAKNNTEEIRNFKIENVLSEKKLLELEKHRAILNKLILSYIQRQYAVYARNRQLLQKNPNAEISNTIARQNDYVPFVLHRQFRMKDTTIAGRFMIDVRDPTGEEFPWDGVAPGGRALLLLLFFIVICLCVGGWVAVMLGQEKKRQRALEAWM
ncbi:hypothetical protein ADEAN_000598900 [Angomonas deanei]|uniref:Uncharacterized protein n=1 Tax=Angomonas deanei TaxID=59799 RepID=A0A7G2CF99_9TRYP|nr:hypothetical protein ADEAN_000598900 [Angomonas deanei]